MRHKITAVSCRDLKVRVLFVLVVTCPTSSAVRGQRADNFLERHAANE